MQPGGLLYGGDMGVSVCLLLWLGLLPLGVNSGGLSKNKLMVGPGRPLNALEDVDLDYNDTLDDNSNTARIPVVVFNGSRPLNAEEKLIKDLFRFYSEDARAGLDSLDTVTVEIQYTLLRIQKLDERTQVLTTTGLVITEWTDERLTWDPEKYNNLTEIVVKPTMVWLPEISLMNGAEQMAQDFDRMGVMISYDGKIHWEPGGIFTTTCDIDITFFPFDKQTCPVMFGAWAYYSQRMNITNSSHEVVLHDFTPNGEWEILDTSVYWNETTLPCCPDIRYPFVVSTISLKRRITYYFVNIILPCFMLSVLVLVSFCIPPEAGEKISCGISVLLAFTVFLLLVSESVPRTSLQLPVIALYLTCTMILGATSLSFSIVVLNVHYGNKGRPVPRWIQIVVLSMLAGILCMQTRTLRRNPRRQKPKDCEQIGSAASQDMSTEQEESGSDTNTRHLAENTPCRRRTRLQSFFIFQTREERRRKRQIVEDWEAEHPPDWTDVSRVLDRLFFYVVLCAMLVGSVLTLGSPYFNVSVS